MSHGDDQRDISMVIPICDEEQALPQLTERILAVAAEHRLDLRQLIFVDDGSKDGSWSVLERLSAEHPSIEAIRLRRNFGKATALNVGIEAARGSIIVTMDGDLQDDPSELPRFVEAVANGYDLVSGWRQSRDDPPSKTLPSWLYNYATARLSGVGLHDFNCGYKAYRREIFDHVELYGDLHRYVPVLADSLGFRIGELPVQHHHRPCGRSKYGIGRLLRGFVDLLSVLSITRYARSPGHLFGGTGTVLLVAGLAILSYLTGLKLVTGADIGGRPLLMLGVLAVVVGLQILFFGILAELINSRTDGIEPRALIRERTKTEE